MRKRKITFVLVLALATALLAACSGSPTPSASGQPAAPGSTSAPAASTPKAKATATPAAPKGDGTLKISLNVLNSEQKQDQYAVFFAAEGAVEKGKALTRFLGPFTMDADEELVLDIEKDLKTFIYKYTPFGGPNTIDLAVARVEDSHIRNPLCEPVQVTFLGDDMLTTDLGNELTVDIADSALNDLYPEDVLLIKIVPPTIQDGGGYPTIKYGNMGRMQKGSAGPDFLVTFPVEDFKKKGIREATVVIEDFDSEVISEPLALTFDENGRCEQGPLVIVKTTE